MNMPAKFRFETLHRVRKLEEKTRLRELGVLMNELENLTFAKNELIRLKNVTRVKLSRIPVGKHQTGLAQTGVDWMNSLDNKVELIDFQVEDTQALIEKKKEEVTLAHRQRKMFDKLREKYEQESNITLRRLEEGVLNDIAVTRFAKGDENQAMTAEVIR